MGNSQASPVRANRASTDTASTTSKLRPQKEHKRHGVVAVKIHTVNNRNAEDVINHVLTPKGALLHGSSFNVGVIIKALEEANYPLILPAPLLVPDSRAHKLLVTYCQGWQLIPFPEVFSRHSGTCVIVGDRNTASLSYPIKVGDCFRLGSVGVVVSELKLEDQEEERLDAKTLEFLKDEALAFDTCEELAALATDEIMEENMEKTRLSEDDQTVPNYQSGLTNGEKFICYMCYETHNTIEDPLIAPCECKGDTRFLHVHCLQKWYHSSAHGAFAQVIRTTGNGAPACKICGSAYKTNFRRSDGKRASILEMENNGPYLSLVVVTHHDTNPGLFNTKFRLNFGRRNGMPPQTGSDDSLNTIVIGRSSSCAMVLDYRTVSTTHAKITYSNGKFVLTDNNSSNGTLVYLQHSFPLPYSQPVKVRMGRTTITMQAKRSWTAAIRSYLAPTVRTSGIARNNNNSAAVSDITTLADREVDLTTPHPMVIHQILASLPNLPAERNERNELLLPNGTEHDFLNARSYTVRTLNDPSAEVEYDHDLYSAGLPHSAASLGLSSGQLSPGSPISSMTATLQQNLQLMNSLQYPATYLGMQHRAYAGHPGATPTTATALNGGGYYTRPLGEMEEINNNILMNASIHHMLYATTLDAAASPVQSPAAVAQGERMDVATPATGTMLSPILEHPPAGSSSSGRMGSSTGRAVLLTDSNGDVMSAESYSAGFEKVNHPTMVFRTTSPLPDDGDNSPSTPHRPGGTAPRAAPATGPATPPRHHSPSTFLKDEAMGPVDDLEHSTIADDQTCVPSHILPSRSSPAPTSLGLTANRSTKSTIVPPGGADNSPTPMSAGDFFGSVASRSTPLVADTDFLSHPAANVFSGVYPSNSATTSHVARGGSQSAPGDSGLEDSEAADSSTLAP